ISQEKKSHESTASAYRKFQGVRIPKPLMEQCDQIRSVDKVRLLHNMGELPSKYCHQVLDILVEMFSRK
ncbi:MAG: hypothetical protein BRC37_13850, partial [Cyanobacteria bacterium QH_3_48_40]